MARATPAAMAGWGWVAPIGGPGEPQEPTGLCDVRGALSGEVFRIGPRAAPPAARPAAALRHHEPFSKKKVFWKGSWCRAGAGSERPGPSRWPRGGRKGPGSPALDPGHYRAPERPDPGSLEAGRDDAVAGRPGRGCPAPEEVAPLPGPCAVLTSCQRGLERGLSRAAPEPTTRRELLGRSVCVARRLVLLRDSAVPEQRFQCRRGREGSGRDRFGVRGRKRFGPGPFLRWSRAAIATLLGEGIIRK